MMNERIKNLQKILNQEELDGVLYATSANMQYFLDDVNYPWQRTMFTGGLPLFMDPNQSGHALNKADCILFIPTSGEPVLFETFERATTMLHLDIKKEVGYFARMTEMLLPYMNGIRRIGLGESCNHHIKYMLAEINSDMEVVDAEEFGWRLRKIKDAKEIATMRKAATFTDEVMEKVVKILKPGITANQVEEYLCQLGREAGCKDLSFPPSCRFVKSDDNVNTKIDAYGMDRPLEPGCSISFDIGFVVDGYCSDYGRSFYTGNTCPEMSDGYKALQEAQLYLFDKIKPGVGVNICHDSINEYMTKVGQEKYLRKFGDFALMGHQIGIDVHEHPWLHNDQEEVFEPGMIMCIEPKFWRQGKGFVRVEDMVLITETGCESLTVFDRKMFELDV